MKPLLPRGIFILVSLFGLQSLPAVAVAPGVRAEGVQPWITRGFADFAAGACEDGGSNLYVNAKGRVGMIHSWDVNGDGFPDLVLANSHDYTERGPTRVFQPDPAVAGQKWPVRQLPNDSGWSSRVLDLDGDGCDDLVVVNGENGVTSDLLSYVYWGGPNGLTESRTELSTLGAYGVATMDINHDGKLDLVFPSAWNDHHMPGKPILARVYLQGEKRHFADASARFGIEGIAAVAAASADLNGDGWPDLVLANYRRDFETDTDSFIYWGTADGVDAKHPVRIHTHGAEMVLIADLNQDGLPDLIFSGGNQVQVCWNRSHSFRSGDETIIKARGFSSSFDSGAIICAVADLEGEGTNDLIFTTEDGLQIRSANDLEHVRASLPVSNLRWVSVADLNSDGRPDLVCSRYTDGVVFDTESPIFWNSPAGFELKHVSWIPTGGAVGNTAGRLGPGKAPVVVFNNTMSGHRKGIHNYIYLGNETATYGPNHRLELPTDGSGQSVMADLDLDGFPEAVFIEAGALRIYRGGPGGPLPDRFTDVPANTGIQDVQVADFNRDGYLDLLGVSQVYDLRPETLQKSARIYYGSAGGFSLARSRRLPMYGNSAYLADVNRDGFLDVLFTDKRGEILIYLGAREGFEERRCVHVPAVNPLAVNTADLNADGWLDLVISCGGHYLRRQETLRIVYGGPKGFDGAKAQEYLGGYTPIFTAVADFNHDGHLDLAATAYSSATERVLPARIFWGNGTELDFKHPLELPAESAAAITQIDLNRDGWVDLVLACHRNDLTHQVNSLIYWNGPRGFSPQRMAKLPGLGPHGMTARDRGNAYTRRPEESYCSKAFELRGAAVESLAWEAELPKDAGLKFQLRWADAENDLASAQWTGPGGPGTYFENSGESIRGLTPRGWLQYRAVFASPYGARSAQLQEVRVNLGSIITNQP